MAFFARPILDNTQFVQHKDSVLTLSGQTQIASTTGLTLTDGVGGYIPIVATGASNNYVLTYDGSENIIKLKESTASGGTGVYPYNECSTCTVGGLTAGTCLYNENVVDILQEILVPTLNPTLTNPTISSFTINPAQSIYEIGSTPTITGCVEFNAGSINPQYSSACDCRSNGTQCYVYSVKGVPFECTVNAPSNSYPFGTVNIDSPNNYFSATVCYCSGVQPYDSSGTPYCSPLAAGSTSPTQINICGYYPWYWGTEASGGAASGVNRPSVTCIKSLITGGTTCKCVDDSNATLFVDFNSGTDDYLWFAIPENSTSKTCWYESALNSGLIGGVVSSGGNLFPDPVLVSGMTSTSPSWSGQTYKIYVSNYQSESDKTIQLRNS